MGTDTLYAWIDLETNGRMLKEGGSPFEVALILTTDDLSVLYEFTSLVRDRNDYGSTMPQVMYDMHAESGLLKDMMEILEVSTLPRVEDIDYAMANNLLTFKETYVTDAGVADIVLCGSGVSHFDSRWLTKFFPMTWQELKGFDDETKPTIDIGVVRRFMHSFCGVPKESLETMPQGNHRALEDLRAFIAQAREFRSLIHLGTLKWFA